MIIEKLIVRINFERRIKMADKITTINISIILKSNGKTSKRAAQVLNDLGNHFINNGIPTDGLDRHLDDPDCGSYFCTEETSE